MYGNCGPYKCPRSRQEYCYHEVMEKNYKLYLSFENSLCADYITEKRWLALTVYVIPVVLGGGNYYAMLPPHSYIDVKDFASPKDLAIYLKKLDGNDTLYTTSISRGKTSTRRTKLGTPTRSLRVASVVTSMTNNTSSSDWLTWTASGHQRSIAHGHSRITRVFCRSRGGNKALCKAK